MTKHIALPFAALAALAVAGVSTASANPFNFVVTVDTAGLATDPNGPFYLDFQLNEGNGTAPNTAAVTNFQFLNGSATPGTGQAFGDVSGSIPGGITLSDSPGSPFNEYFQAFSSSATQVSFDVSVTQNAGGSIPDEFSFDILDSLPGLPQIPTDAPDGVSLVTLDLSSSNHLTDVQEFGTLNGEVHVPDGTSSLALLGLGVIGLAALRRRAGLAF